MISPPLRALSSLALVAVACSPTLPPPAVGPAPKETRATDQSQLLLFPESNAEALLGRAVQASSDGGWTIAEGRAPGCEVNVRRERAQFHTARKVDTHSMTSLAGGYAKFVSIEANFGRETRAEVDVDNTEVLRADMRGACGEQVIDTVFVGRGKRSLVRSAAATAGADVNVGLVAASPKIDTGSNLIDAIEWKEDQAYGFAFSRVSKTEPLRVRATLPSIVNEGESVEVRFDSEKPAWLVVYYLDSNNHANLLWPSNEELEPRVAPGEPATLPSKRERAAGFALRAALAKPGVSSRETLVVYAFSDKRDFDAVKPATGSESADGAAFSAEVMKKLGTVPISRWSSTVAGYTIQPRTK